MQRNAGIAGILAGIGLAVEAVLWIASGWTSHTWDDPATALTFLESSGAILRAAVFTGALNLTFAMIQIAGLAERLRTESPTSAAATLHFGVIGVGVHGLVPIGLWLGTPAFLPLAAADGTVARGAWAGFAVFLAAAGGVGSLFLGLSMLAVGSAAVTTAKKSLPVWIGWVGILAGITSSVTVLAADTALGSLAEAAYMPSLLLSIVFRIAAGTRLMRTSGTSATRSRTQTT